MDRATEITFCRFRLVNNHGSQLGLKFSVSSPIYQTIIRFRSELKEDTVPEFSSESELRTP